MNIRKTIVVFAGLFLLYIFAASSGSAFLRELAGVVCECAALALIFASVIRSENRKYRINYALVGVSLLSWTLADMLMAYHALWAPGTVSGKDLIPVFYFISTFTVFFNLILYSVYRFSKWSGVQLLADVLCISFSVLWSIWVIGFNKCPDKLDTVFRYGGAGAANIATDIAQIILISILSISIRKDRLPPFLRLILTAGLVYSLTNLGQYYLYFNNLYVPFGIIEAVYVASALAAALATRMYYIRYPQTYDFKEELYCNIGHRKKGVLLLLAPLAVLLFKGFAALDIVILVLVTAVHRASSEYIQNSVKNKELLEREKNLNLELELRISERMRDLEEKNSELMSKNEELKYISEHDQLTGLYNREFFMRELKNKIDSLKDGQKIALVLWNVDRLKGINDTYGHSIGDRVLMIIAERVGNIWDESALLSRLGGDEFAIAIERDFTDGDYERIGKEIVAVCGEPVRIGQYSFRVSVSLGMSVYPYCGGGAETLLKNAGIAMHHAKERGCGSRIFFYRDIDLAVKRRDMIGTFLKNSDYDREFYLHYQPQFAVSDGRLVGVEALLRWDCPQLGRISPAEFIPIAEKENLIIPLGDWVVENAVKQISSWNHSFGTNLKMGINISPKQINQTDFLDTIKASIMRNNAFGGWIDIEITEGVALDDEATVSKLKEFFKREGISLSLDDFGTGYSSLGYLNMLIFDRIKIAKPLTDKITTDASSVKIVSSIITLARSLDILTVSEGVETKEQFDILSELGCDQIQGFYLGRPMTPQGFFYTFMVRDYQKRANRYM